MGGAHKSMEHAEHIEHAGHAGDFGGIVAVSMSIIAALLAVVTMLSHRSHNETILLHSDANRLQTQGNVMHTQASDTWAFYQAKRIRTAEYKAFLQMLPLFANDPSAPGVEAARKEWQGSIDRYEGDGKDELKDLQKRATGLTEEAERLSVASMAKLELAEVSHARSTRFDLGELGVELGVVLCSIAVLTKSRRFWASAITVAALGVVVALSGLLNLFVEPHGAPHEAPGHEAAGADAHGGGKSASETAPEKAGGAHAPAKEPEQGGHSGK